MRKGRWGPGIKSGGCKGKTDGFDARPRSQAATAAAGAARKGPGVVCVRRPPAGGHDKPPVDAGARVGGRTRGDRGVLRGDGTKKKGGGQKAKSGGDQGMGVDGGEKPRENQDAMGGRGGTGGGGGGGGRGGPDAGVSRPPVLQKGPVARPRSGLFRFGVVRPLARRASAAAAPAGRRTNKKGSLGKKGTENGERRTENVRRAAVEVERGAWKGSRGPRRRGREIGAQGGGLGGGEARALTSQGRESKKEPCGRALLAIVFFSCRRGLEPSFYCRPAPAPPALGGRSGFLRVAQCCEAGAEIFRCGGFYCCCRLAAASAAASAAEASAPPLVAGAAEANHCGCGCCCCCWW